MELPFELSRLLQQNLESVRLEPEHHIYQQERLEILEAFGLLEAPQTNEEEKEDRNDWKRWYYLPVNLPLADRAFGWLAMLTARKVLPLWEQFGTAQNEDNLDFSFDPAKMIETGEGVLSGKISSSTAKIDLCNRFYYGMIGIDKLTTKNVYCAMETAYAGLEAILSGTKGLNSDFTARAAIAYVGIDENEPGLWAEENVREQEQTLEEDWLKTDETPKKIKESSIFRQDSIATIEDIYYRNFLIERDKRLENFKPITFSPQKELEFWEWWLTEAIPQAWEFAEKEF